MKTATKFLVLALALALPSTMNAAGDDGKKPHRKHSKSPDKHKKHKEKTPQDKALHDAKKAMEATKKILDEAIKNEEMDQLEQIKAENNNERLAELSHQVFNKMLTRAAEVSAEYDNTSQPEEGFAQRQENELRRIRRDNAKIINDSRVAYKKLEAANQNLAAAQAAVNQAQENYNAARAYYEQLLAQAAQAKK